MEEMEEQQVSEWQVSAAIWGAVALGLVIFNYVYSTMPEILAAGFWAKSFALIVATVTGTVGALIGDGIRRFAMPSGFFTTGGMGSIIWMKLFWMIGPQTIGVVIGTFLGLAIVLG
ncbi:MAG: hypothetical protein ACK4SX_12310 [Alcanivoracaceae bacterium]